MSNRTTLLLVGAMILAAAPLAAQSAVEPDQVPVSAGLVEDATEPTESTSTAPQIVIQHMRPADQRGLNVFEPPKHDGVPYTGFRLDWGAGFTQQFQAIEHSNTADEVLNDAGTNTNQLMDLGWGFNNATANLALNAQVAPGIRVALTAYLSSRHHSEAWVKDGYILIDESPIDAPILNSLMDVLTLKVGHFEIDYGDAHYRRTDNGNAMHNPFVGNLIMDAFTTQVGAHAYARIRGLIAMAGVTGGEIKGEVRMPDRRGPAFMGKLGYDRQFSDDLRIRLMGSVFTQDRALSNTLYSGDRAGSRYYFVMENTGATVGGQAWSGNVNPGFSNEVTAFMVNPFVEVGGLELFGTAEFSSGSQFEEEGDRSWTQYAGDLVYRMFDDRVYAAGRYNTASGELRNVANEVSVDRIQLGAGWFVTPNILFKGEWVTQQYNDFPTADIRNGGEFDGFVLEGVVAF
ncbi:MAG TPA: hypothetical protein VMN78_12650 [Longimicrobiales bacterium]|nr:hypothetical protein [Longimicrobiales bacterium]